MRVCPSLFISYCTSFSNFYPSSTIRQVPDGLKGGSLPPGTPTLSIYWTPNWVMGAPRSPVQSTYPLSCCCCCCFSVHSSHSPASHQRGRTCLEAALDQPFSFQLQRAQPACPVASRQQQPVFPTAHPLTQGTQHHLQALPWQALPPSWLLLNKGPHPATTLITQRLDSIHKTNKYSFKTCDLTQCYCSPPPPYNSNIFTNTAHLLTAWPMRFFKIA